MGGDRVRVSVLTTAIFCAALLAAPAAQAQTTTTTQPAGEPLEVMRWTVTPFIGAGFSGDLENSPVNLGAALAYNWSSRIAFEGQFAYMNAEQGQLFEFETNVWTLDANVLYHFAEEQWIPYLALGIGMMRASTDIEDLPVVGDVDDASTELAINFGGGVKRQLTDRVRLRGDLRYFNGGDLAPDFWRVTAGLTFALGR